MSECREHAVFFVNRSKALEENNPGEASESRFVEKGWTTDPCLSAVIVKQQNSKGRFDKVSGAIAFHVPFWYMRVGHQHAQDVVRRL